MTKTNSLRTPKYRRQKQRGSPDRAFVELNGQRIWLGRYETAESRRRYDQVIAEWLAHGRERPVSSEEITIVELVARFGRYAQRHYQGSREFANYQSMLILLRGLYGPDSAKEFTPARLKAVRQKMITKGWSRRFINRQVVRLRTVFKWGVAESMVPVEIHAALSTVPGLQAGRSDAKEKAPVRAVTADEIDAVLPHVSPTVRDMIQVQLFTGMRPGELCNMRLCDIDMAGEVWLYRPVRHKNSHRGLERVVPIGPKAQEIIKPYLSKRRIDAYVFSPTDSACEVRARRREARKTPLSCGNSQGTNRKRRPARQPGERFTPVSFARAIAYGCEKAYPPPEYIRSAEGESKAEFTRRLTAKQKAELKAWRAEHRWSPNQLRHTAATRIRREAGLEVSRCVLGHTTSSVTERYYAEADQQKAAEVIRKIG